MSIVSFAEAAKRRLGKVHPLGLEQVFSSEVAAHLSAVASSACYGRDQTIVERGELPAAYLLIQSGVVRRYILDPRGRRQITSFCLPGEFINLATYGRSTVAAEAVAPVKVHAFAREIVYQLAQRPDVALKLQQFACHELRISEAHQFLLGRCNAAEKLANFLLSLRERRAISGKMSVTVELPMTRRDIADFLGLSVETVSRSLAAFAREKTVLFVPDGVRLLDVHKLYDLSSGLERS